MLSLELLTAACDDTAQPDQRAASAHPSSILAPATVSAPAASINARDAGVNAVDPSSSAPPEKAPLQLLRLTLSSGVKDKEPIDELKAAGPGQRVFAHLVIRNRSSEARRITLIFRVNNEERSTVDLKVEPSWSYRTWGYNTLRVSDKSGNLTLEVRELGGTPLTAARLAIATTTKTAPLPRSAGR